MSAAMPLLPLVVSVPRGFGDLLADELRSFGALDRSEERR